jgi:hypothetical protein
VAISAFAYRSATNRNTSCSRPVRGCCLAPSPDRPAPAIAMSVGTPPRPRTARRYRLSSPSPCVARMRPRGRSAEVFLRNPRRLTGRRRGRRNRGVRRQFVHAPQTVRGERLPRCGRRSVAWGSCRSRRSGRRRRAIGRPVNPSSSGSLIASSVVGAPSEGPWRAPATQQTRKDRLHIAR